MTGVHQSAAVHAASALADDDRPPRRPVAPTPEVATARGLLEMDGGLPEDVRVVDEGKAGATPTFMVVADYGWAERILCGGCYERDANAIRAAVLEACAPA